MVVASRGGGGGPIRKQNSEVHHLQRRNSVIPPNRQFVVPKEWTVQLLLFRRIFSVLHAKSEGEIPVVFLQRALMRLCRILDSKIVIDASQYDTEGTGTVGWHEFVQIWRTQGMKVTISFWERLYITLEDPSSSLVSRVVSTIIMGLILLSSVTFVLSTMPEYREPPDHCEVCEPQPDPVFSIIEYICVVMFTVEYSLRLIAVPKVRTELFDEKKLLGLMTHDDVLHLPSGFQRLLKFLLDPSNIIDLIAILPFYLEKLLSGHKMNLTFFRVMRLTRIFRVMRVGKYQSALRLLWKTLRDSMMSLNVLSFYLGIGIVLSSSMVYFAEIGDWNAELGYYERVDMYGDGKEQTPFISIPAAFWWCLVTATTVGYGDLFPTTLSGRIIGAITIILSLVILALPVGVISSNFNRCWEEFEEQKYAESEQVQFEQQTVSRSLERQGDRFGKLQVEVYDDDGSESGKHVQFLGEAELDLPFTRVSDNVEAAMKPLDNLVTLELKPNLNKAKRRVAGTVTLEVIWRPNTPYEVGDKGGNKQGEDDEDSGPFGNLCVKAVRAKGLRQLDWRVSGFCDPFCQISMYSNLSQNQAGDIMPEVWRSKIEQNSLHPEWNEEHVFEVDWRKMDKRVTRLPDHEPDLDFGERSMTIPRSVSGVKDLPEDREQMIASLHSRLFDREAEVKRWKSRCKTFMNRCCEGCRMTIKENGYDRRGSAGRVSRAMEDEAKDDRRERRKDTDQDGDRDHSARGERHGERKRGPGEPKPDRRTEGRDVPELEDVPGPGSAESSSAPAATGSSDL